MRQHRRAVHHRRTALGIERGRIFVTRVVQGFNRAELFFQHPVLCQRGVIAIAQLAEQVIEVVVDTIDRCLLPVDELDRRLE